MAKKTKAQLEREVQVAVGTEVGSDWMIAMQPHGLLGWVGRQ